MKVHADLKTVAPDAGPKKVPVKHWREGMTREVEVEAGPLGVAIDNRPARAAVLSGRAAEGGRGARGSWRRPSPHPPRLDRSPRGVAAPLPATRPYETPTYWAGFILIGSPD